LLPHFARGKSSVDLFQVDRDFAACLKDYNIEPSFVKELHENEDLRSSSILKEKGVVEKGWKLVFHPKLGLRARQRHRAASPPRAHRAGRKNRRRMPHWWGGTDKDKNSHVFVFLHVKSCVAENKNKRTSGTSTRALKALKALK
jgi:hypothetical protein